MCDSNFENICIGSNKDICSCVYISNYSLSDICLVIVKVIEKIINYNSNNINTVFKPSIFDANLSSNYNLSKYINRIVNPCKLQNSTLIHALILLDRFCNVSGISLSNANCFKLIFIALVQAIKINEDKLLRDKDFAIVGGIELKEFVNLEYLFIKKLDYNIFTNDKSYCLYSEPLLNNLKECQEKTFRKNIINNNSKNDKTIFSN